MIAGGLGGLACVLNGQPLDTIKVKLQTYPHLYRSTYHAITHTFREEGLRAFYAGATPAVFSNVAENAVLFVFYGQCQRLVQWAVGVEDPSDMTVLHRASAGSLASVFSSVAITPPDRIKCKLQVRRQELAAMSGSMRRLQQSAPRSLQMESSRYVCASDQTLTFPSRVWPRETRI